MLTQGEADILLNELKEMEDTGVCEFPCSGMYKTLDLSSIDGKDKFIVDLNRKGQIKISKCTFQKRYRKDIILLRLDIDGPPHTNPDQNYVSGTHLHIYMEGYGDKWAFPLPVTFTDTNDLIKTLKEFLEYCKVVNIGELLIQEGLLQ